MPPRAAQELATEKFKEIQNAYAVLSDKHERSWYDQHRESILRGGRGVGGGGGDDSDEEEGGIDLWPLFSSAAFEGFGDGKGGFYAVYAEAFRTLDQEEAAVRESAGDYSTRPAAPDFGAATSEWAVVRDFYANWEAFTTARLFSSADKYDTRAAPNRQVRRAVEKAAVARLRPHVPPCPCHVPQTAAPQHTRAWSCGAICTCISICISTSMHAGASRDGEGEQQVPR